MGKRKTYYVCVYLVDRAYGGPEEGGWYYNYGIPQLKPNSLQTGSKSYAQYYLSFLEEWCRVRNLQRPSIYSVLSEGRYEAVLSTEPPAPYPAEKPIYS